MVRFGFALRVTALVATLVTAAVLLPAVIEDSGAAAAYLLGPFVVLSGLPLIPRNGRAVAFVTTAAAAAFLAWAVLLGVGIGVFFLPAAVLLVAAALASSSAGGSLQSSGR